MCVCYLTLWVCMRFIKSVSWKCLDVNTAGLTLFFSAGGQVFPVYTVTTGISPTHYWWAFRLLWVCFSDILETLNYSMLSTFWTTQKPEWKNWYIVNWTSVHEFGPSPGVGDGQGGLVCCDSWGRKESDTTEWLNWTERPCNVALRSGAPSATPASLSLSLPTTPPSASEITSIPTFKINLKKKFFFFWPHYATCGILVPWLGTGTMPPALEAWSLNHWTTSACMLYCFSHVQLCETPWTEVRQAPLSMGFSREEYWSRLLCPPPGDLPDPGIKPTSLMSPALAGGFFTTSATWEVPKSFLSFSLSVFFDLPFSSEFFHLKQLKSTTTRIIQYNLQLNLSKVSICPCPYIFSSILFPSPHYFLICVSLYCFYFCLSLSVSPLSLLLCVSFSLNIHPSVYLISPHTQLCTETYPPWWTDPQGDCEVWEAKGRSPQHSCSLLMDSVVRGTSSIFWNFWK